MSGESFVPANCSHCGIARTGYGPKAKVRIIHWARGTEDRRIYYSCSNPECIKMVATIKELAGYTDVEAEQTIIERVFRDKSWGES